MAITVDKANAGTNFNDSTSTTIAVNTSQTIAAGAFIVVCVAWFDPFEAATLSSVSGGSLSWSIDKQGASGVTFDPEEAIASAQAPSGLASGTTITATFSASISGNTSEIGVSSFLGVKTSAPVDGTPIGPVNNGGATDLWTTGNYTLSAGSLMVGAANCGDVFTNTMTAGIELYESASSFTAMFACYRIESSAGSYALSGDMSAPGQCDAIAVAYLAAGDAAPENPIRYPPHARRARGVSW